MGQRRRIVGFSPAGQPLGSPCDQRPIRPKEEEENFEVKVDGLRSEMVRSGRGLNPVAKAKSKKEESEKPKDAEDKAGVQADLTQSEEPALNEAKPEGDEVEAEQPFWERRRGVEGEAGPSVGGGAQKGAQSFPEPGSGTTDGGGGGV